MSLLKNQLQHFFEKEGPLSKRLSNYEPRLAQTQMCLAIADMLEERKGRLVVEAGTGTGKSLAYLAVALLLDTKVLISTATKTLQDQLFQKDLPLALDAIKDVKGAHKHIMLMKGRSNYLCLLKAEEFRPTGDLLHAKNNQLFDRIQEFILHTKTGDRAEIDDMPDDSPYWSELNAKAETCLGQNCPLYLECHVTQMRQAAKSADILIVNHSLLCADRNLRLNMSSEGDAAFAQIIPDMDLWIVDEAHTITDIATRHFGVSVSLFQIKILVRDFSKILSLIPSSNQSLFSFACEELTVLFTQLFLSLSKSLKHDDVAVLRLAIVEKFHMLEIDLLSAQSNDVVKKAQISSLNRRLAKIRSELEFMLSDEAKNAGYVAYIEGEHMGQTLMASPVDASQILSRALWSGSHSTVLTSATLAVNGKLNSFLQHSGFAMKAKDSAENDVKQLILSTPFNFENQSAFYVPSHICSPVDVDFQKQMENEIRYLISISKGGTFLLFTSLRALNLSYQNLKSELETEGLQVFKQGDAPKLELLREFTNADETFGGVLFATHSFWEGVDVQGKALRMVVIDRLPFRSPEDPILKARTEQMQSQGLSAFALLSLPEAALALKQGAGRLLRTRKDAGVVALLDKRIYQKSYGRVLLGTLPPMQRLRHRPQLKEFWDHKILSNFC
jgi:ATP-dependent DNA helicase DinG